jgi:acyl carrier protein
MNDLERELKELLVKTLALEDITADDIPDDSVLFGEGLGLDSVDALELGVAIQKKYNVKISAKSEDTRRHFANIGNLAAFIRENQNPA